MNQARDITRDLQDWLHEPDRLPPPRISEVAPLVHRTPQHRGLVPPLTRRFPSMFSATKYLVVGAIVALFSGMLLVGLGRPGPSEQATGIAGVSPGQTAVAQPTPVGSGPPAATPAASTDTATGATLVVAQDGSGEHTSVSAAVEAAAPGDTILIEPGLYEERVLVDKSLTLRGAGDATDVVIAASNETEACPWFEPSQCALQITAFSETEGCPWREEGRCAPQATPGEVTVSSLTLRAAPRPGSGGPKHALIAQRDGVTLDGIVTEGAVSVIGDGTRIHGSVVSGDVEVSGDAVLGDLAARLVYVNGGRVEVRDSRLVGLRLGVSSGVVERNEVRSRTNRDTGDGILVEGSSDLVIRENTVRGHRVGLRINRDDATRVVRNLIRGNETGVRFNQVGTTILRGNAFCKNETDIRANVGQTPATKQSCRSPWIDS